MAGSLRARLLVAAALCAAVSLRSPGQGGWRQWDVHLRDGRRVEANPLGAPDTAHVSVSVGGYQGHDSTIARGRIDYIAARKGAGPALPPAPARRTCEDVIVRRDGRRTTGHVTLKQVMYSEGVVGQNGIDFRLEDIAYIKFAPPAPKRCGRGKWAIQSRGWSYEF